jgi:integrase/recombinase XerD
MSLEDYLKKHYTASTVKVYLFEIKIMIAYLTEEKAIAAHYMDIIDYVGYMRKKHKNPRTIGRILASIKVYYKYLIEDNQREDHPCKYLRLRDSKRKEVQLQDLFTKEELEMLLDRKERVPALKIRNQIILSLLIYQGLTLLDLVDLTVNDINLNKATVYIKAIAKTNARTLPLKPMQIMLFYAYLNEERPRLVKVNTDKLLITLRGTPEKEDTINYLIETFKPFFPGKNMNATIIRQSVITNLLKEGKDLRVVQVFAGHKNSSTTEQYKQTEVEGLKAAILKYHPLG